MKQQVMKVPTYCLLIDVYDEPCIGNECYLYEDCNNIEKKQ